MKITNIQNILFLSPKILIGIWGYTAVGIPAYRRLFREYHYTLKKQLEKGVYDVYPMVEVHKVIVYIPIYPFSIKYFMIKTKMPA